MADDEAPALEELAYLLRLDPRVSAVTTATSGEQALRALERAQFGAVFLDIRMPGLDGLDVARLIDRFANPPDIVFVTAFDDFALDAFELKATDYLLKPVRAERLAEAVRRFSDHRSAAGGTTAEEPPDETIAVELAGVIRYVNRSDVRYVEAQGDYVRLHVGGGASHLIRASLAELGERWHGAGFVRIHRSSLVSLRYVDQVCLDAGRWTVRVDGPGGEVLAVSRRHVAELRDVMVRRARRPDPR